MAATGRPGDGVDRLRSSGGRARSRRGSRSPYRRRRGPSRRPRESTTRTQTAHRDGAVFVKKVEDMPEDRILPGFISARIRDLVDGGELEDARQVGPFGLYYVVTDRGAAALAEDLW